jgi:hypothetical protein
MPPEIDAINPETAPTIPTAQVTGSACAGVADTTTGGGVAFSSGWAVLEPSPALISARVVATASSNSAASLYASRTLALAESISAWDDVRSSSAAAPNCAPSVAPAKLCHMTRNLSANARHSLLWNVAEDLSRNAAPLRRAAGPHRGWTVTGIWTAAVAVVALTAGTVFAQQLGLFWRSAFMFIGIPLVVLGTYVAVWAGTETSVRVFNQTMRASEVLRRILSRIGSFVISAVVTIWLVFAVQAHSSTMTLAGIVAIQMIAVGLSDSALSASPPLIGVLTRVHPGRAQFWSLSAWLVACIVAGYGVAAIVSRLQSQVATVSVIIAIAAVFVATYTRQRNRFDLRLDTLQKSLSTLHRHLIAGRSDPEVIEAATDLEAALTLYPPVPFSLPIQLPIDNELRACLFYALTGVTGLPYREVLTVDAAVIEKRLAGRDLRYELAELVWELRRRALRSASVVSQQNTTRYDPPARFRPFEPATEKAVTT